MKTDYQQVANIAEKTTYTGSAAGLLAIFNNMDIATLVAISVAIGGFFLNWYYRYKENKRAEVEHKIKVNTLKNQCDD